MTTFSQPQDYSTILTDTITIDSSSITSITNMSSIDTITLTSGTGAYGSSGIYTISPSTTSYTYSTGSYSGGTITLDNIQSSFDFPEEWRNSFPDWSRVQDMCEKYPGLKIAFDNFKTFYQLVKDDYDNPKDKE